MQHLVTTGIEILGKMWGLETLFTRQNAGTHTSHLHGTPNGVQMSRKGDIT